MSNWQWGGSIIPLLIAQTSPLLIAPRHHRWCSRVGDEYTRALAAETLELERTFSDLLSHAYGLTQRRLLSCGKPPGPAFPSHRPQYDSPLIGLHWGAQ